MRKFAPPPEPPLCVCSFDQNPAATGIQLRQHACLLGWDSLLAAYFGIAVLVLSIIADGARLSIGEHGAWLTSMGFAHKLRNGPTSPSLSLHIQPSLSGPPRAASPTTTRPRYLKAEKGNLTQASVWNFPFETKRKLPQMCASCHGWWRAIARAALTRSSLAAPSSYYFCMSCKCLTTTPRPQRAIV